jgi:transposase-like protein
LLTTNRELYAAKRFLRKTLRDEPFLSSEKISTDDINTFVSARETAIYMIREQQFSTGDQSVLQQFAA